MGKFILLTPVLGASLFLAGCGDSGTSSTPTQPPSQPGITDHLKSAGEEIKQAATKAGEEAKDAASKAAAEIKPAYEKAKEKTKEAIHDAAEAVSEKTATQPDTQSPK